MYFILASTVFCVHWEVWYLQILICFCVALFSNLILVIQLYSSNNIFTFPRGSVKLYDDIYSSDMIVASPLSLNSVSDFDWMQVSRSNYDLMCLCVSDSVIVYMHLQTILGQFETHTHSHYFQNFDSLRLIMLSLKGLFHPLFSSQYIMVVCGRCLICELGFFFFFGWRQKIGEAARDKKNDTDYLSSIEVYYYSSPGQVHCGQHFNYSWYFFQL